MTKTQSDKRYVLCPVPGCGHDRHQIHDRGKVYQDEATGRYHLEWDEVALQCLKCLHVFTSTEANTTNEE